MTGTMPEPESSRFRPPPKRLPASFGYGASMVSPHRLAELASALADPTRASMVSALFDGSTRPAGELAAMAGVTPSTASAHLSKLVTLGLLAVEARGRHRYYRLGGVEVAAAIEALGRVLPPVVVRHSSAQRAVRELRLCYDHLAGRLAVALCDALVERRWLRGASGGFAPTRAGRRELEARGLVAAGSSGAATPCLDWTERRDHLGGPLGAALASQLLEEAWVERIRGSRALRVSTRGQRGLAALGL
jgi:DNA-binding transcriptional ArsR family regulator